jgi:hypothetical protein
LVLKSLKRLTAAAVEALAVAEAHVAVAGGQLVVVAERVAEVPLADVVGVRRVDRHELLLAARVLR